MNRARFAIALTVAYSVLMLAVDRRLKRTGGPGIIPFELAGSETRAREILADWGPAGRRLARISLLLDFGYMLTYGAAAASLVEATRRRSNHPVAVLAPVAGAVACDAAEGVKLLNVLSDRQVAQNAASARRFALTKFLLLVVAIGYLLICAQRAGRGTPVGTERGRTSSWTSP